MSSRKWAGYGQAILVLSLMAGGVSACATTSEPAPVTQPAERSNYIVTLMREGEAPRTPEQVAQARQQLEADRAAVLNAVFGSNAPAAGASFVSIYAFEIHLTAEEAARLARHSAVVHVRADQLSRPTDAGPTG